MDNSEYIEQDYSFKLPVKKIKKSKSVKTQSPIKLNIISNTCINIYKRDLIEKQKHQDMKNIDDLFGL